MTQPDQALPGWPAVLPSPSTAGRRAADRPPPPGTAERQVGVDVAGLGALDAVERRLLAGVATPRGLPLRVVPLATRGLPPVPPLHPSGEPVDERYRIEASADGIEVGCASPEGRFRALTTLAAVLRDPGPSAWVITDAPRLGWRGLTLDVARTPMGLPDLIAVVELLASLKMNVLHLHLSDDQGWRFPVAGLPDLALTGGAMAMDGRPGGCLDPTDYRTLVTMARQRFVQVVPEIDVPGHTGALLASVPGIAAGRGTPGEYASRLHLDPDSPETYRVLGLVLDAVRETHPTPWLHLGGDEAFGMSASDYTRFFRRLVDELGLEPERLIGWQEAIRADVGFGVLQVWRDLDRVGLETDPQVRRRLGLLAAADLDDLTARGREDVARISAEGRTVVLSPALHAYLDRPYAETDLTGWQPRAGLAIYRPRTVRQAFEFDLDTVVPGLEPACVAGLEGALWTETVPDAGTAQTMLLPRLAGLAQRAWEQVPTSWAEHAARLARVRQDWDARGWQHHRIDLTV